MPHLPEVLSIPELRALCRELDLQPRRSRGQNFVIAPSVLVAMRDAAQLRPDRPVVEIGPGFGALTAALLPYAKHVYAVELEQKLISYLHERFRSVSNLTIVHDDARKVDLHSLGLRDLAYDVVANLPYQITSLVIRRLTSVQPRPKSITLLVQREVAQRIIAPVGEKSLLSIAVEFYANAKVVRSVPPTAFWPQPEVYSAILRLELKEALPDVDESIFFSLVRSGFQGRRKTLRNALAKPLGLTSDQAEKKLREIGISPQNRAQNLSLTQWLTITRRILSRHVEKVL